jgi:hypothetical protein
VDQTLSLLVPIVRETDHRASNLLNDDEKKECSGESISFYSNWSTEKNIIL